MNYYRKATCILTAAALFLGNGGTAFAAQDKVTSVLPTAGANYALASDQVSLSTLQGTEGMSEATMAQYATTLPEGTELKEITEAPVPRASSVGDAILRDIQAETGAKTLSEMTAEPEELTQEEEDDVLFRTLVIADVNSNSYVNVRSGAGEDNEIIGKLYDESVGTYISESDGWYKIQSGSVTGYVKGEFCVTGEDAIEMARKVDRDNDHS